MKTRTVLVCLVAFFAGLSLALAADANLGVWKLDEAKSTFAPGGTKNTMVVYSAAAGDMVKVTVDGVDKDGKATHNEWTGKFDGKDYAVTGEPNYDSRAYTKVDANTIDMTVKKAGKVIGTGRIVVAADGKSRTVTTKGSDPADKSLNFTATYVKQ